MTCIVGIAQEGKVWIGADSAAVSGQDIRATALRKVFRRGQFLIGYTSSFRMGQLPQFHLFLCAAQEQEAEAEQGA